MTKKKVLVVDGDPSECALINRLLQKTFANTTVQCVGNGREAINSLMGNYDANHQIQENPDVIIISNTITDMPPAKICDVILSYYRFRNIKFYLVCNPVDPQILRAESLAGRGRVMYHGYIQRPLGPDSFAALKTELDSNTSLALFPLLGVIKTKLGGAIASVTSGVKAATAIACVGAVAVTIPAFKDGDPPAEIRISLNTTAVPEHFSIPQEEVVPEVEEPVAPVEEKPSPVIVQPKEADTMPVPEEKPPADTVRVQKQFSIGVENGFNP